MHALLMNSIIYTFFFTFHWSTKNRERLPFFMQILQVYLKLLQPQQRKKTEIFTKCTAKKRIQYTDESKSKYYNIHPLFYQSTQSPFKTPNIISFPTDNNYMTHQRIFSLSVSSFEN